MYLFIHELTHLILTLGVGYFVYRIYKKPFASFFAALTGGLFIDLDHLFDYFLAFGSRFNLIYFIKGYQFMKNEKIYITLHSWEWVVLLLFIGYFINKSVKINASFKKIILSIILSFSLSLFSHLIVDVWVNHVTIPGYSIIYRVRYNFELKKLVTAQHYKNHMGKKSMIKF